MKQEAMLLSIKPTEFKGRDGNTVQCGKITLGIVTDNGFEPTDYYVTTKLYNEIKDLIPVGEKTVFNFNIDILRKKIKLVGVY